MVRCSDESLYSGITTDLERRISEHNGSGKGAKYTKPRQPVVLVYSEIHASKSEASIREAQLKNLTRSQKLLLLKQPRQKAVL